MPEPAPPSADTDRRDTDTWPWLCLDCGVTIYHDGELCRDCNSSFRPATYGDEQDASSGFVDWMREQPAPTFVLKVSVLSGFELALTAFWLRTLLRGSFELASVIPGVV